MEEKQGIAVDLDRSNWIIWENKEMILGAILTWLLAHVITSSGQNVITL